MDERERIFREVLHEYLLMDAERQVGDFFGEDGIPEWVDNDFYELLVDRFTYEQDCNVPENVTWQNLIYEEVQNVD